MTVTIKILGSAHPAFPCAPEELGYVKSFEDTPDGRGWLVTTADRAEALAFPSHGEAFVFWKQQSRALPLRPDGRPNRPLTAFTVEIEIVP